MSSCVAINLSQDKFSHSKSSQSVSQLGACTMHSARNKVLPQLSSHKKKVLRCNSKKIESTVVTVDSVVRSYFTPTTVQYVYVHRKTFEFFSTVVV